MSVTLQKMVVLFVCLVYATNKNTLKMKPWCKDDLKRNGTLSHNIVLSNSPELPEEALQQV